MISLFMDFAVSTDERVFFVLTIGAAIPSVAGGLLKWWEEVYVV